MPPPLISLSRAALLNSAPKQICLSGPGGFLGSRVLNSILDAHQLRRDHLLDPGEVILLSSSPGRLMERLTRRYGKERMKTIRATRVDYYNQLEVGMWHDQLGSLGLGGEDSVFVNLAALAGPQGNPDNRKHRHLPEHPTNPMRNVNYIAPVAAAQAAERLGFGHWIQASTQATKAERAGQVPYSRWKAMCDFSLKSMHELPVTVVTLGLLYCKTDKVMGQALLNVMDLALLPYSPVIGNGTAPLQPLELNDAAERLAFLALTEPKDRPIQCPSACALPSVRKHKISEGRREQIRIYDAVGPEKLTLTELMRKFAEHNGTVFRPVHIGYRNAERIMNIASFGNINRQFISLLRSEQGCNQPVLGDHTCFEQLLGPEAELMTIDEGLLTHNDVEMVGNRRITKLNPRRFPYSAAAKWVMNHPGVIRPGIRLLCEMAYNGMADVDASQVEEIDVPYAASYQVNETTQQRTWPSTMRSGFYHSGARSYHTSRAESAVEDDDMQGLDDSCKIPDMATLRKAGQIKSTFNGTSNAHAAVKAEAETLADSINRLDGSSIVIPEQYRASNYGKYGASNQRRNSAQSMKSYFFGPSLPLGHQYRTLVHCNVNTIESPVSHSGSDEQSDGSSSTGHTPRGAEGDEFEDSMVLVPFNI